MEVLSHNAKSYATDDRTLGQLHRWPDDGHKYELVHEQLLVTSPLQSLQYRRSAV